MGIIPNLVGIPMGGIEVESLFNEKIDVITVKKQSGKDR